MNITHGREHGFTLIEALVALVVLSFGLLGVAAMQFKALQSAHAGYQRAVASLAAQDVVELLWAALPASPDCPDSGDIALADWAARWGGLLPGLDDDPIKNGPGVSCEYEIEVRWQEGRFANESPPVFEYTARLPTL